MKDFEEFKNRILGKVYVDKHNSGEVYVICEVCGITPYNGKDQLLCEAAVIYVTITVPNDSTMTTYNSDKDKIQINHSYIEFKDKASIRNLKNKYCISENIGLDKVADYYKIFNTNVKYLLKEIGTPL